MRTSACIVGHVLPGLCDDEPIGAGEVVRIETTGGGWRDPLDSDPSGLLSDRRRVAVTALDDDQLDVRPGRAAIVPVARLWPGKRRSDR